MSIIFVTGIGTGIGKTVVSAIVAEALEADYWKPIQAGTADATDSDLVKGWITNGNARVHPELYRLDQPVSPHIAAKHNGLTISIDKICSTVPVTNRNIIVEGAGGIMVPLNEDKFIIDLISAMDALVILVSRNYLGSINHSLLTAAAARHRQLKVSGWIFNDQYLDYENEIVNWTGYPHIGSVPAVTAISPSFISEQAALLKKNLQRLIC